MSAKKIAGFCYNFSMAKNKITAPAGMSAASKKHFNRLVEALPDRWQAHHVDSLVLYCKTTELVGKLQRKLEKMPMTEILVKRDDGQQQVTPLWNSVKDGTLLIQKLGVELGLFPVSESKSKLDMPEGEEDFDEFARHRTPKGLG